MVNIKYLFLWFLKKNKKKKKIGNDFVFNLPKLVGVVHSLDTFSMFISFISLLIHPNKIQGKLSKKKKVKWTEKLYFSNRLFGSVITFSFKTQSNYNLFQNKHKDFFFCIYIIYFFRFRRRFYFFLRWLMWTFFFLTDQHLWKKL